MMIEQYDNALDELDMMDNIHTHQIDCILALDGDASVSSLVTAKNLLFGTMGLQWAKMLLLYNKILGNSDAIDERNLMRVRSTHIHVEQGLIEREEAFNELLIVYGLSPIIR